MQPLPSLSARPQIHWRSWLILWAALVILQATLLANNAALDSLAWRSTRWFTGDKNAYSWAVYKGVHTGQKNLPFYQRLDPPMTRYVKGLPVVPFYHRTEKMWRLFRDLGEPWLTIVLIAAVSIYDRRRWKAGAMLLVATALAGGIGELIRATAGRFRPEKIDGANQWAIFRGFHQGTDLSWPSGHATLAFATAAVLVYLSPRGKWLFLILALGCAIARVMMDAHFWSDVIFGSVLGWTIAWFTARYLDRPALLGNARENAA